MFRTDAKGGILAIMWGDFGRVNMNIFINVLAVIGGTSSFIFIIKSIEFICEKSCQNRRRRNNQDEAFKKLNTFLDKEKWEE